MMISKHVLRLKPLTFDILFADCVLYAVGKPVYHRYTEQTYGWWMRDPNPQIEKIDGEKYWFTREDDAYHLFYYDNKSLFRKDLHKYISPV